MKDERRKLLGRLKSLILADFPRLEEKIAALERIADSKDLANAQASRKELLKVVEKAAGKATLVDTFVSQEIAKADEEKEKAEAEAKKKAEEAKKKAAEATEAEAVIAECVRNPSRHLHVDDEPETITRCIAALTTSIEAGERVPADVRALQRQADIAELEQRNAVAAEDAAVKYESAVLKDDKAAEEEKAAAKKAREDAEKNTRAVRAKTAKVQRETAEQIAALEINRTNYAKDKKQLSLQLARFEEAGRRLATIKKDKLEDLKAKHDALPATEQAANDTEQKETKAEITTLKDYVVIPNEDALSEYADYEQWYNKFFVGYEYSRLSEAFAKGFPRMGATIGFHYPRQSAPEISSNWRSLGVWHTFTLALTNSAEATNLSPLGAPFASSVRAEQAEEPEPEPADNEPNEPKIERALEFESQIFWAFWRNDYQRLNPRLRTRIGPILVAGARMTTGDTFAHHRAYLGIRSARSPETFFDVLFGKTGGLRSRRFELRGQYAIPRFFAGGARLVVGGTGNFGVNKRRHGLCDEGAPHCTLDEPDSVRFFVSYDISGEGLLGRFLPKKKEN